MDKIKTKKFRVEFSATKIIEVSLNDDDLGPGETMDEAAESLAFDNLFYLSHPDMVSVIQDWDVNVEEVIGPLK